ncbi:hypothetical protein LBMAG34_0050 [Candidatus Saccharibacteria bacterium]|nr:hypothetical protein LBMAG34_0050 [Candidatus Saccharibacteria bacterium]
MNYFDNYLNQKFEFEIEIDLLFNKNDELIILDIGACEGEESIKFAKKYPNSRLLTFEPVPSNVKVIKKNFRKYKVNNAELFELALSDVDGITDFYVSSGNPETRKKDDWDYGNKSSSLLEPAKTKDVHPWLKFNKKIKVETAKLYKVLKRSEIKWVDFLYMDVQGAELKVLNGMEDYLYRTKAIWLEVENLELYKNQPLKKEIEKYMKNNGFYLVKSTVDNVAGDQLYINSRLVNQSKFKEYRSIKNNNLETKVIPKVLEKIKNKINTGTEDVFLDNERVGFKVSKGMLWAYTKDGYYEKNVLHWIQKILSIQDSPVFYDIGANNGYYSLVALLLGSSVCAFEPTISSYKISKTNINNLRKFTDRSIEINNLALSDKKEQGYINIYSSSGNNSIAERNIPKNHELKYIKKQKIKIDTLDSYLECKSAKRPTFIKIDVEGNELMVLNGAKKTIEKDRPSLIIEYSESTSNDAGYNRKDIYKFLSKLNYKIFGLSETANKIKLIKNPYGSKEKIDNLVALNMQDYNKLEIFI